MELTIGERIRILRDKKNLNLTQSEFAQRIGLKQAAIGHLENGDRNITDRVISSICREFGVNEEWLRTGSGEMFVVSDNTIIADLEKKGYDVLTCKLMKTYLELPEAHREKFNDELLFFINAFQADEQTETTEETSAAALPLEEEYRAAWNNGLTEEEALTLVRQRYSDGKKGLPLSTIYGNQKTYGT